MIVIGLVVHTSRRAAFEEAARTLTGVTLDWAEYEHEHEIRRVVQQLLARQHVDGLLLGPVPYAASRDLLPDDMCVEVVEPAGLDLALAFYRAVAHGWSPTPVSVDTYDPAVVAEVAEAIGLDRAGISCLPYRAEQSAGALVDLHRSFLDASGGGYIISGRTAVARQLDGILPVFNSGPVPSTIRAQVHGLALRIQSKRADAQRFAAGVFLIGSDGGAKDPDRARVGLMHALVNTADFADAWVENRGLRGVLVFAPVALFEKATHQWTSLPPLGDSEQPSAIAAGFGIGPSARTCVQLAERAAAQAEREAAPCGYLIEDGGVIIGPMGSSRPPLTATYREHGDEVENLAKSIGLSPATLSRLAAVERSGHGRPISPSDLADALGIADASGRRLVRKLVEHGLAIDAGSAQAHRNGRPTRLYQLRILAAITPADH